MKIFGWVLNNTLGRLYALFVGRGAYESNN